MARRQVLVQLDDDLIAGLDALADEGGISRSEVIRQAAGAWLRAREEALLDRRHAAGYASSPEEPGLDDVLIALASASLAAEDGPPYRS